MRESPRQLEARKLVASGRMFPSFDKEEDGWYARWHGIGADNPWVDEYVRSAVMMPSCADAEYQKHETLHDAYLAALRSRTGRVIWDEKECLEFAALVRAWNGNAAADREAMSAIVFSFDPEKGLSVPRPEGRRQLKALGQAVSVWTPLTGLKKAGKVLRLELTRDEAENFLRFGARQLREAGYTVEGVDIAADVRATAVVEGEKNENLRINLSILVDGEEATAEELRFLLEQGGSLVFFHDRWIEIDRALIREALVTLERGVGRKSKLMSFALGIGAVGRLEIDTLAAKGWIRGFLERLRRSGKTPPVGRTRKIKIAGFNGELRRYQVTGVEWLSFLTDNGFGALLADEMGLGKTVQVIAYLARLAGRYGREKFRVLIVSPLTLTMNWRHEIERFAPSLADSVEIVSYNRLVREYSTFSMVKWTVIVLDEAQIIKNHETQAAKAVRALNPPRRVALTGTPIENSTMDLWALEDFLNPGLLGDRKTFLKRFAKPIAQYGDGEAARRLRRAMEPFVLRRLKSNDEIAAELGTKREVREYCALGDVARREYESALAAFRATVHTGGDVFALLSELKLICDGEGKMQRLCELLTSIFESGESALVFTQYARVGAEIKRTLKERFGRDFPYLHGGLSVKEREEQIRIFKTTGIRTESPSVKPNAFILSLKAGGFGLNLVKATHVIHFDRWWNPAVESQATDRAHRIGQSKDVLVHLMITEGTLEERIDAMLERKESLKRLLSAGEEFWQTVKLEAKRDV